MVRVRLMLCVLLLCAFAVAAAPQEDRSSSVTSVVTAAAPIDKIRFAGSQNAVQMRIEVMSAAGAVIYDSSWRDCNLLDWSPKDSSGQPLPNGTYRLWMRTKNLAGQTSEQTAALRVDSGGLTVADQPGASPKITLTAHDGETGQLITTSGDLSFRFGDFLNRKDTEAMRLTPAGELNVSGLVHAKGIMFPDGTILTTAAGTPTAGETGTATRQHPDATGAPNASNGRSRAVELRPPVLPLNPATPSAVRKTPRPNFTPAFQFVVGDTGVNVGVTNPAYNLNVMGTINTATSYQLGGTTIVTGDASDTFVGENAGLANSGSNQNSFFGASAGRGSTTGTSGTFIGYVAGNHNTTGAANTFLGDHAGFQHTVGGENTFVGQGAGFTSTAEGNNSAFGWSADITAGVFNSTAVGSFAKTAQPNTVILGSINGINGASATASTGIGTNTPNQYLAVGGGITVDYNNTNNGSTSNSSNSTLSFGSGASNAVSGEAIASQRTASGGNQYGLDFYTLYLKRMSIANNGNVSIVGNLTKGSGSFKIDHPLDPENKYLYHSFVESPDMKNIYDGVVTLGSNGDAVVQLPDWFETLNQDFRYQLTCLHGFAPVYIDEEIAGNQFKIAGGKPGMKVSWQVTGIRHDPYANAHRIQVEEDKPPAERGTYLHPAEYGH